MEVVLGDEVIISTLIKRTTRAGAGGECIEISRTKKPLNKGGTKSSRSFAHSKRTDGRTDGGHHEEIRPCLSLILSLRGGAAEEFIF